MYSRPECQFKRTRNLRTNQGSLFIMYAETANSDLEKDGIASVLRIGLRSMGWP
jgi:hypothetical protein